MDPLEQRIENLERTLTQLAAQLQQANRIAGAGIAPASLADIPVQTAINGLLCIAACAFVSSFAGELGKTVRLSA